MFRDKDFLIKEGLSDKYRKDTYYILGELYDEIKETGEVKIESYNRIKDYLEKHREILNNKDYFIVKYETILARSKELFERQLPMNKELTVVNNRKIGYCFNALILKRISNILDDVNWQDKTGVYGIFVGNEIIYVGKTNESFKDRFLGHVASLKKGEDTLLYNRIRRYLKNGAELKFYPIIIVEDLCVEGKKKFSKKDIETMELALITALQPECNVEGRLKPYVYR